MLFTFLKKQKEKRKKIDLLKTMIIALEIGEDQKTLYIESLDIVEENELEELYLKVTKFVEKIEIKEISEITSNSFAQVAGMTQKEAEEKKKDINAFSFLIHNI